MKRSDLEGMLKDLPEVYIPRRMPKSWSKADFLLDCHKCEPHCHFVNEIHIMIHIEGEKGSKHGLLPALFFSLRELMSLWWLNRTIYEIG